MKFLGKTKVENDGVRLPEKVLDFLLVTDGDELYFYEDNGKLVITRYPAEEAADVSVDDKSQGPFSPQAEDMISNMFQGLFGGDPSNLEDVAKAMEQFLGPLVGNISEMMKQFQNVLALDEMKDPMPPEADSSSSRANEPDTVGSSSEEKASTDDKRVKINILDDEEDSSEDERH